MTDQLVVLLRGQIVGDWRRNRLGQYTFTYREDYRSTGRVPLSPALPISDTRFGHQAVAAYVDGLLPENPDVRAAGAAELKSGEAAFDLLAAMGMRHRKRVTLTSVRALEIRSTPPTYGLSMREHL